MTDSPIPLPITGGCQCGTIRYQTTGLPLFAYACHCGLCQNRTGSAYSMGMPVFRDHFSVIAGVPLVVEKTAPSGNVSITYHCPDCFIRTHTYNGGSPDLMNIRPGTLDDRSWLFPAAQIYAADARPFALLPGILTYDTNPEDWRDVAEAWHTMLRDRLTGQG